MRKTWLITGTSSGLGLLLVQKLLRRGDRVVATVRQPAAHCELQQQYGDSLQIIRMDLTDANAIRDGVNQALRTQNVLMLLSVMRPMGYLVRRKNLSTSRSIVSWRPILSVQYSLFARSFLCYVNRVVAA